MYFSGGRQVFLPKENGPALHTVICRRPVKPSFNRKNGAPVLKGKVNLIHAGLSASDF
jgi:hypothetical protein